MGILISPNLRKRIKISVRNSIILSSSSTTTLPAILKSHRSETWRHTGMRTEPPISLETPPPSWCILFEASIDLLTLLSNTNTMNVQCIKPQWHSSERTKKLFFHSVFVRYNQTDVYSSQGTLVGKRDKRTETSTTGCCGLNKTWYGGKATIVNFSGFQIVLGEGCLVFKTK